MVESIFTRRRMLSRCGGIGVPLLFGGHMGLGENLIPAERAIDHVLLGASDLESAIAWVERKTGVKAAIGGSHPGAGTRNALISLGARRYLEIIAPDPKQTAFTFQIDVRKFTEPRLITWAAATTSIEESAKTAGRAGYQLYGPSDGSRARPDGRVLRWKTLRVVNQFGMHGVEPIPFFIQWASDSLHPTQDSPGGCVLQSFEIAHPDPGKIISALKKLGIEAKARQSANVALTAELETPKGRIQLS